MATGKKKLSHHWTSVPARYLPFADAVTDTLPMGRLLRLSLFQIGVGMAIVLLNGTLNRVMVVELDIATWLVSLMISVPLLIAPFRALIGHRSDHHESLLGWRRVPYLWMGTLLQFGGLAIMPFALIVLATDSGPFWLGESATALAFFLLGIGLHTTQTAGLALATDIAPKEVRPRVVALLYVMLLAGMVLSSLVFSFLLRDFNTMKLIQVIQGAAVATVILNLIALWKQEKMNPEQTRPGRTHPTFVTAWKSFCKRDRALRLLIAIGIGTMGFSMQDILLEPYGAEILNLSVSATTGLTAVLVAGMLLAFYITSKQLSVGADPIRLAGFGAVIGAFAFALVIVAGALVSPGVFRAGTFFIGFGGGLFSIGTLIAVMNLAPDDQSGIALGAWGAVQATAAGVGIGLGGAIRDGVEALTQFQFLGEAFSGSLAGYGAVYHIEIALLFITLIVIGPLARLSSDASNDESAQSKPLGLSTFPG